MALFLPSSKPRLTLRSALNLALLLIAAVFFAFHATHIDADFPNHSPWMDWSKYTDEGWYGDAAIRHFQRGHWYVPGDFNPGVTLPVWPFLESLVFYFTGVTLTAARALTVAIFALILIASYLLLRRSSNLSLTTSSATTPTPAQIISLAPAIAVLLLAVSPFCFVFTRLAILEPLLVLLTLLALLATSYIQPPTEPSGHRLKHLLPSILLGVLVPLMVLTKTTAVFLVPAIAWLLWARAGYRLRPFIRVSLVPAAIAATLWLTYYLALVRPRFLDDYRYLFAANAYTGITADTAISIFSDTIRDGLWMGRLIFPLSLLAILVAVLNPRLSRRNPLIPALVFWAAGYTLFLAYHNNLQPRYYLVIAVPLTLLVPAVFAELWQLDADSSARHPHAVANQPHAIARRPLLQARIIAFAALALALTATIALDARQTLSYVRAPEYTFINAAARIQQIIAANQRQDPAHNPLVLSISGSNLSLMTGLPSICDDFGTMQLGTRVATYRPGWFLTWNHVEDDKMEALAPYFHLQRVAEFPVMDDPERNLLILYRLDPPTHDTPLPAPRQHPPIPRLLRTKLGQQPSVTQLQH